MAVSGTAVALTFAIQLGVLIIACLLFSKLRLVKSLSRFYAPKRFDRSLKAKPKRLPPGFFSWMMACWFATEDEIITVAGLDAAVVCRCMSFGVECFLWVSLWTLIVILPINLSGNQIQPQLDQQSAPSPPPSPPSNPPLAPSLPLPPGYFPAPEVVCDTLSIATLSQSVSPFDKCSLSNIESGSPKMWAHAISITVVTFIVLKILVRYNQDMSLLRIMFLANSPRGGPSHTALMTDIPGMEYGTIKERVKQFAGGTVFIMLPQSLRKKILDYIETGVHKVGDGVSHGIDTAGRSAKSLVKSDDELLPEFRNRSARKQVNLADKELDVWHQAEEGLGPMEEGQQQEENLKRFLMGELEYSYGSQQVAAINPVWNQRVLDPLLDEYNGIKQKLEDHMDHMAYKLKRRMKIEKRLIIRDKCCGNKVDAIDFWTKKLKDLNEHIEEAKAKALTTPIPSAFITFNSRSTQVRAANALHHHDESAWRLQPAPYAREVVWENLRMRSWERSVRSLILWALYILLLLFYIIPVTIVQGVVNLQNLAKFPGVSTFVNLPFISQVLQGILPSLVLMIFLAILPMIIRFMCYLSGFPSLSAIDFGVVNRYFYFQVVAVFIYNMVAGSLINQYEAIIQDPTAFITILGAAIPQTASFFITYVLTAGIGKIGIKFLRLPNLAIFLLLSRVATTARARARLWADQYRLMGPDLPSNIMPFFLGLIYCLINPIMSPVVLIFFTFAILFERYFALYVYKSEYESGGRVWAVVFHELMLGLYFMQIFMMILLGIKQFKGVPIAIPAPIITFIFHIYVINNFNRPWTMLSVHDAAMLDIKDREERGTAEMSDKEIREIREAYLSPVFKIDPEDHQLLLREAEITSRWINGEVLENIEEDCGYVSADEADEEEVAKVLKEHIEEEERAAEASRPKTVWEMIYGVGKPKGVGPNEAPKPQEVTTKETKGVTLVNMVDNPTAVIARGEEVAAAAAASPPPPAAPAAENGSVLPTSTPPPSVSGGSEKKQAAGRGK